ncbi:MAG: class I lanthipeptide [Tannerellaceae bacterium]|nr:class I lanthipeptide [Tannerellaceae bacterium]
MKKIVLKKEVVARISDNEMSHLKGGTDNAQATNSPYLPCVSKNGYTCNPPLPPLPPPPPPSGETCGTDWTCNG